MRIAICCMRSIGLSMVSIVLLYAMAGGPITRRAPQVAEPAAASAEGRSDASLGHIDLPDFVVAAIAVETRVRPAGRGMLRLPADWCSGLDDLPGFDPGHCMLRFTCDRARLRDRQGRSLAFLGRAHPLVRRAISSAPEARRSGWDNRVSVVRADEGDDRGVAHLRDGVAQRAAHRVRADLCSPVAISERPLN